MSFNSRIKLNKESLQHNTLMVQGCTSDAGKSVLVAGLCRVLARQNISVAPFKPQNMALNSAVTVDGGEIGRAQALQAIACGLEPHTDFNPILLKPSSDTGAQVIVHGKALTAMQAAEYHDYKKHAMAAVMESHQRLQQKYSKIVVEGAGSPAEINLRANDIANMGFAEQADCPVVLVADIDRGGVFAHLVGTLDLLSQSEQDRVVGFVINKFRGDIALLESGLEWLEQRTKKPVLGVVPFIPNFFLDAEDAISVEQLGQADERRIKVVVPVLPRISNHTDFDALRLHPEVDLTWVSVDAELPDADLIILPGSKNVIQDLQALKKSGWQAKLNRHLRYGGKLMGICGGYQMLGNQINDPHEVESSEQQTQGFGFIDSTTELHPEKQLKRVRGHFIPSKFLKSEVCGYEIHCGVSTLNDPSLQPLFELSDEENQGTQTHGAITDGVLNAEGNVIGSYLHGLFDSQAACNTLLAWAGLNGSKSVDLDLHRQSELDRLADTLEESLRADFLSLIAR